jgi:hypothetical protein
MVFAGGVACGVWYMSFTFKSPAGISKEKIDELRMNVTRNS